LPWFDCVGDFRSADMFIYLYKKISSMCSEELLQRLSGVQIKVLSLPHD
jgi:hypothetical protein